MTVRSSGARGGRGSTAALHAIAGGVRRPARRWGSYITPSRSCGHEGLRLDDRDVRRRPARWSTCSAWASAWPRSSTSAIADGFGGGQLPDFVAPGTADLDRRHDGHRRVHLPRHGRVQVAPGLLRHERLAADPGQIAAGHHPGASTLRILLHDRRIYFARGALFGAVAEPVGLGVDAVGRPRWRAVVRPAAHGLRRLHHGGQGPVRAGQAVHLHAACSCSRARSSRSIRCRSGCSGSAGSRRSGTARELGRVVRYGYEESPLLTVAHFVFLVGAGRCWLGARQPPVRQEAGPDEHAHRGPQRHRSGAQPARSGRCTPGTSRP